MLPLRIEYRLMLITPVHVGTGTGNKGFLDKYLYRDRKRTSENEAGDIFVIPGSTVKGRLRAAVFSLAQAGVLGSDEKCQANETECNCITCQLFGSQGYRRGLLNFDDALPVLTESKSLISVRSGIAVDRFRRVARDGALYNAEIAGENGMELCGEISGFMPKDRVALAIKAIKTGFAYNFAIGFGKGRGLGWCRLLSVEEVVGCSI